jgi:hypothetical protein
MFIVEVLSNKYGPGQSLQHECRYESHHVPQNHLMRESVVIHHDVWCYHDGEDSSCGLLHCDAV